MGVVVVVYIISESNVLVQNGINIHLQNNMLKF